MRLETLGVAAGVDAATTGVFRLSPSVLYIPAMPPPRQMGLMTERWGLPNVSSSSSGSCFTTTWFN